jgi:hypothetical protein
VSPPRYWVGVACRAHVQRGLAGGFAQLGHGKRAPLARMKPGDWIVYYSPATEMRGGEPCQSFTAIGRVVGDVTRADNEMFRRPIDFLTARDAPIRPMLNSLSFIPDAIRWGYPFRRGHFEMSEGDFRVIAEAMGAAVEARTP